MQTDAQRRWYQSLTPEQREVRRASQRIANLRPDRAARRRAAYAASNSQRIFVGKNYVGREGQFPYPRAVVEKRLFGLYDDFKEKQADEMNAFRKDLAEGGAQLARRGVVDNDLLVQDLVAGLAIELPESGRPAFAGRKTANTALGTPGPVARSSVK